MNKKRNPVIEMFRFVFAMMIAVEHLQYVVTRQDGNFLFKGGYLGVEFFFILTGFLMAQSVYTEYDSNKMIPVGIRTWSFLKRKLAGIVPYYLSAYIITFLIWSAVFQYGITESIKILGNSIFQIGMLEMAGNQHYGFYLNGTWYISAMIIAIFVIYPLLSSNYDLFVRIITPILLFIYLFYGFQYVGGVCMVTNVTGIVYDGMIRAVADISLGCLAFEICRNIRREERGKTQKCMLSLLEICSYTVVIVYACVSGYSNFDFTALAMIAMGVLLTFSDETYLYQWCSTSSLLSRFFCFLGKLSLPIYLTHLLLVQILFPYIAERMTGYGKMVGLYIIFVILTAVVFYGLVEKLVMRAIRYKKQKKESL